MQKRIRQKAKLTTTGSKTPSISEILQGGYCIAPSTVQRAQWAMSQ